MQLSRLIEAVNSLIIRSCGGKAHKRITNNLKFIGQTYTIKEPDVNRNCLSIFLHNKICEKNPLSFYLLFFYNPISSFFKKWLGSVK